MPLKKVAKASIDSSPRATSIGVPVEMLTRASAEATTAASPSPESHDWRRRGVTAVAASRSSAPAASTSSGAR
jgi:hypothetical protein